MLPAAKSKLTCAVMYNTFVCLSGEVDNCWEGSLSETVFIMFCSPGKYISAVCWHLTHCHICSSGLK